MLDPMRVLRYNVWDKEQCQTLPLEFPAKWQNECVFMVRNKGMRRRNAKERRRAFIKTAVSFAAGGIFVAVCLFSIISSVTTLQQKNQELAEIEAATAVEEAENQELQRILEDDDMQAYMEKVAIEELNYAYPNERRFYDSSRD